ncbi:NUDIX domain-containing protein [Kribbella sp. VKM Ac-2569]|uniref:NUDIX domain-containing protein n=1 Tax=Kribbella sp. VKM Ac-2569 TaxID=2512220 RepID=UPI001F54665B|nr:NUDIX domain-containing protein [Kribbella sp. VKM Ac-2569]
MTAAREVEEETGWRPRNVKPLVSLRTSVGTADAESMLFVSYGADYIGEPEDINEAEGVNWLGLDSIRERIDTGEIIGAASLVGLLHVLARSGPADLIQGPDDPDVLVQQTAAEVLQMAGAAHGPRGRQVRCFHTEDSRRALSGRMVASNPHYWPMTFRQQAISALVGPQLASSIRSKMSASVSRCQAGRLSQSAHSLAWDQGCVGGSGRSNTTPRSGPFALD